MFTDLQTGYQSMSKWLMDAEEVNGEVTITSPDGRARACVDKKGIIHICQHHKFTRTKSKLPFTSLILL